MKAIGLRWHNIFSSNEAMSIVDLDSRPLLSVRTWMLRGESLVNSS